MAFVGLDLIARLLLIERKDAIRWGVDPTFGLHNSHILELVSDSRPRLPFKGESELPPIGPSISLIDVKGTTKSDLTIHNVPVNDTPQHTITPLEVLLRLLKSPRAVVCIFSTFVYG